MSDCAMSDKLVLRRCGALICYSLTQRIASLEKRIRQRADFSSHWRRQARVSSPTTKGHGPKVEKRDLQRVSSGKYRFSMGKFA